MRLNYETFPEKIYAFWETSFLTNVSRRSTRLLETYMSCVASKTKIFTTFIASNTILNNAMHLKFVTNFMYLTVEKFGKTFMSWLDSFICLPYYKNKERLRNIFSNEVCFKTTSNTLPLKYQFWAFSYKQISNMRPF